MKRPKGGTEVMVFRRDKRKRVYHMQRTEKKLGMNPPERDTRKRKPTKNNEKNKKNPTLERKRKLPKRSGIPPPQLNPTLRTSS